MTITSTHTKNVDVNQILPFDCIMIIDDSEVDKYYASKVLELCNYAKKVVAFSSALDALDYLQQYFNQNKLLPDLILLDKDMPFMDGFDFIDAMLLLPNRLTKEGKIVLLSSNLSEEDKSRAVNHPYILKYIPKPLDIEHLNLIKTLIG